MRVDGVDVVGVYADEDRLFGAVDKSSLPEEVLVRAELLVSLFDEEVDDVLRPESACGRRTAKELVHAVDSVSALSWLGGGRQYSTSWSLRVEFRFSVLVYQQWRW